MQMSSGQNSIYLPRQHLAGGAFLIGNLGMARLKAVINASNIDNNSETISNPKLFAMDGESSSLIQGVTFKSDTSCW